MSSDATATPDRFLAALGSTYAAPADDRTAAARLDPEVTRVLAALAARLIPGDEHWPSGAEVEAPAHVAAVLERAPQLRDPVLALLAEIGERFAEAAPAEQIEALRRLEAHPAHAAAFRAVYEWVCEAYYRHPRVEAAILDRTGFDLRRPLVGTRMAPFDESRLDRVRSLPPRYRTVGA